MAILLAYRVGEMERKTIIQRLAFAKYLIHKGNLEANNPDPLFSISVLHYHDALELSFLLILEDKGINPDNLSFMGYFRKINERLKSEGNLELSLEPSLGRLKDIRKNIKHKGIFPSTNDVEESKFTVNALFEELCMRLFNLNQDEISLIELIKDEEVKDLLHNAIEFYSQDVKKTIQCIAIAFDLLLRNYEGSKKTPFGQSPFYFGSDWTYFDSYVGEGEELIGYSLSNFIEKVKHSIGPMQIAIKIIAFGIDYKKYVKFRYLIPAPIWSLAGKPNLHMPKEINLLKENFDFCVDFITECALKLQQFDFESSKQYYMG
jgi:hypothetical protein